MAGTTGKSNRAIVALRKESVDRNASMYVKCEGDEDVALRKESVDRNKVEERSYPRSSAVALRKESVDRNYYVCQSPCCGWLSLSARRAWIEMTLTEFLCFAALSRSPQGERG